MSIPLKDLLISARTARRLTQQQLADLSGVSVEVIRAVEQGKRASVRLDTLHALAQGLDMQAWELMGRRPGLVTGGESQEVLGLRRAVHGYGETLPEPRDLAILRDELATAWRLYWSGKYAPLARTLPALLSEARAAARSGAADAHKVLAEVYQVVAALLAHLTYEDLAHVALSKGRDAAQASGDPLLAATLHATTTWILARQGLWTEAEHLAVSAAADIEPAISHAGPDQLAAWGELLRYGVTALARAGRGSEAVEMQGMVRAAASAMGGRRPSMAGLVVFAPVIADMSAVGIAVATDDPRRAIELAQQVTARDIATAPVTVQGRYLLNVAYAQMADWRSTDALATLKRVEGIEPDILRNQGIARVIIEELLPRRRTTRLPGLTALAEHAGVPVT